MNASSVNGDGSFIAQDIEMQVDAREAGVHVLDRVDDDAAGAQELGVHFVHVVAAVHRVARDQRHRGGALRQDRRAAARCNRAASRPISWRCVQVRPRCMVA